MIVLPISCDANEEIELYLRTRFEDILRRCKASMRAQWPSAEEMKAFVIAAGGSFIYATTVLRYAGHRVLTLQMGLHRIIQIILDRSRRDLGAGTSADTPFAELGAFYTLILQRIPVEIFSSVHLLLALICRKRASGAVITANLLGLFKSEFEAVCDHASAVTRLQDLGKDFELDPAAGASHTYMHTSRSVLRNLSHQIYHYLGGEVSFYHNSFTDFIPDPLRA